MSLAISSGRTARCCAAHRVGERAGSPAPRSPVFFRFYVTTASVTGREAPVAVPPLRLPAAFLWSLIERSFFTFSTTFSRYRLNPSLSAACTSIFSFVFNMYFSFARAARSRRTVRSNISCSVATHCLVSTSPDGQGSVPTRGPGPTPRVDPRQGQQPGHDRVVTGSWPGRDWAATGSRRGPSAVPRPFASPLGDGY